jgi:hypothetical protein
MYRRKVDFLDMEMYDFRPIFPIFLAAENSCGDVLYDRSSHAYAYMVRVPIEERGPALV